MKRFLTKTLIMSVSIFLILVVLDFVFSKKASKTGAVPMELWVELMQGGIEADIVVAGNSRALLMVDTAVLSRKLGVRSFHVGMAGGSANRNTKKYDIYRSRNARPRLMIYNIDPWTLQYQLGYQKEQFFPFFWDKQIREAFFKDEPFTFAEKYLPFYRYQINSVRRLLRSKKPHKVLTMNQEWSGNEFTEPMYLKEYVDSTTLEIFDDFLARVTDDSVKVVFTYAPLHTSVEEMFRDEDYIMDIFRSLAEKYDIPILDYTDMEIKNDTTYFWDSIHLNTEGAIVYTDTLANDIIRLGLLDQLSENSKMKRAPSL